MAGGGVPELERAGGLREEVAARAAHLALDEHERAAGALRVSGRVHVGGSAVWAGAFFNPGEAMFQARDARARTALVLQARGDGRPLAVMLFSGAEGAAPAVVTVTPGAQWGELRLPLADFPGADLGRLRAIAFTAQAPAGEFHFDLDQVEIR